MDKGYKILKSFKLTKDEKTIVSKDEVKEVLGISDVGLEEFLKGSEEFVNYDQNFLEFKSSISTEIKDLAEFDEILETHVDVACEVLEISEKELSKLILDGKLVGIYSKEYQGLAIKTSSFVKYLQKLGKS